MSKRKKSNNYFKYNKKEDNKNFASNDNNLVSTTSENLDNNINKTKSSLEKDTTLENDAKINQKLDDMKLMYEKTEVDEDLKDLFIDGNILENGKSIHLDNIENEKEIDIFRNLNENNDKNNKNENSEEVKENIVDTEEKSKEKNIIEKIKENVSKNKEKKKEENKKVEKIEVEKSIETKELKVIGKRNFFVLLFKFIFLLILSLFKAIGNIFKKIFIHIKDFFEDEAEELDRKIREIKDEEVIRNQKRNLDYEKYNTKRIYKDLEKAEKYRDRASRRVNTEKYFEDEIEKERINNKVLVSENLEKDSKEKDINRKQRIEKKKNEILELRKRRKEQRDEKRKKLKEEKNQRIEENRRLDEIEESIRAEEERIIKETEDLVKSMEEQLKLNKDPHKNEDYNYLFSNEFGIDNDLDTKQEIKESKKEDTFKKEFTEEKNINKIENKIEPKKENEESKENKNIVIDNKTKRDILRYIDVPESEVNAPYEKSFDDKAGRNDYAKAKTRRETDSLFEVSDPSKVRVSQNQDGFKKALENIEKNNMEHNEEIIYGKRTKEVPFISVNNSDRKFNAQEDEKVNQTNQTIILNTEKIEELEEIKNEKNEENLNNRKKNKKNRHFLDKKEKRNLEKADRKEISLDKENEKRIENTSYKVDENVVFDDSRKCSFKTI